MCTRCVRSSPIRRYTVIFSIDREPSLSDAWLVSGNPFDVTGAVSLGMNAAWVKRGSGSVFDPWEIPPTVTVESLRDLSSKILQELSPN